MSEDIEIDSKTVQSEDVPEGFCDWIKDTTRINKHLLMLKLTLFLLYGAIASLLPYLTIHMQSIGLTVEEIAVIYFALPFTTFLSPPITGFLVDKLGQYKPVVVLALIMMAVCHHSLLFLPPMEIAGSMPPAYIARHPVSGLLEVWWSPCPSRECPDEEELELVLEKCYNHCELLTDEMWHAHENNSTIDKYDLLEILAINDTINSGEVYNDDFHFLLDMHPDLGEPVVNLGMEISDDDNETRKMFTRFNERLLWTAGINVTGLEDQDLRCGGVALASNLSGPAIRRMTTFCPLQKCSFRKNGPEECPPSYIESDDRMFWLYFTLRFLGTVCMCAGVTMMDPIALELIKQYGGEFGRERIFSTLGMAVFSPITGVLIDYFSRDLEYTNYAAAFYSHDILLILSALSLMAMPIPEKIPVDNLFQNLFSLLKLPHVCLFILFLFFLGNFWGFIESFLFLYLKELGAPNYLLGLTLTVGTLSSTPFLFGANHITARMGHVPIIIVAFFSHGIRLVGYSMIEDPWWSFPFEAMEATAVHLMWVAAATYCTVIAPKNMLASIIGVLGMAHFSLGRGSGSFVGGLLLATVGTRTAFRVMGCLAAGGGFAYGILHVGWLSKYEKKHKITDEEAGNTVKGVDSTELEELQGEVRSRAPSTPKTPYIPRVSLMVGFNPRGSLTDLDSLRGSHSDVHHSSSASRSLLKLTLESKLASSNETTSFQNQYFTPQQTRRVLDDNITSSNESLSTDNQPRKRAMSGTDTGNIARRAVMRDNSKSGRSIVQSPLASPSGSTSSLRREKAGRMRAISPLAIETSNNSEKTEDEV